MDLNELRKIAEAEESHKYGSWAVSEDDWDGFCVYTNDGEPGIAYVAKGMHQGVSEGESTARFIAMFDPPTVLALLSRLEQAERVYAKLKNRLESMRRQRDGYRNQLRKTEQQVQRMQELALYLKKLAPGDKHYAGLIDRALDGDGRG